MTAILPFLLAFIVALAIGIYIGKLLFSAKTQAEKISLEEKVLAGQAQIQNFKEALEKERLEKEVIRNEKDSLAIQLSKKEVDLALVKEKELNDLKSRFISTASHEFRTPLATILSSVSLAGKYADKQELEKIFKHLDRVKDSVSNLTDILNDFLSLDKLEEGIIQPHPEPTHVYDLIVDLLHLQLLLFLFHLEIY
jgi:signal transduction histidine kinase